MTLFCVMSALAQSHEAVLAVCIGPGLKVGMELVEVDGTEQVLLEDVYVFLVIQ